MNVMLDALYHGVVTILTLGGALCVLVIVMDGVGTGNKHR